MFKNRVKFGNFVNFSGNNLKSYVVNDYLVLFSLFFWPRPWPRPHGPGLGLMVLASFNITGGVRSQTCVFVNCRVSEYCPAAVQYVVAQCSS